MNFFITLRILICEYAAAHLMNKTNYHLNIEELLQLLK